MEGGGRNEGSFVERSHFDAGGWGGGKTTGQIMRMFPDFWHKGLNANASFFTRCAAFLHMAGTTSFIEELLSRTCG